MGKLGGKRPLSRPGRKWDHIIEIDHQEVGCGSMDCVRPCQDRESWRILVNEVIICRVPQNEGNSLTGCKTVNFSRTLLYGLSK